MVNIIIGQKAALYLSSNLITNIFLPYIVYGVTICYYPFSWGLVK